MALDKINIKTATLDEIWAECESVLGTPYGHNIIGIMCSIVKDRFGEDEADQLFETFQI